MPAIVPLDRETQKGTLLVVPVAFWLCIKTYSVIFLF